MDFKFNFGGTDEPSSDSKADTGPSLPTTPVSILPFAPYDVEGRFRREPVSLPSTAPSLTRCIAVKPVETSLDRVIAFTDVLPGVYEGGFKVWECSLDLVSYLVEDDATKATLASGSVLELGCGHGLPGVMCLKLGASGVHFQDLNEDVLRHVTMPTVQTNVGADAAGSSCTFVGGDWASLSPSLADKTFNLMLSAEGIYNPATYPALCNLMNKHLAPSGGFALFAAKRFYFGVGGGVPAFEAEVKARCPTLSWEIVRVFEDGGSNIREIIKIQRKEEEAVGTGTAAAGTGTGTA